MPSDLCTFLLVSRQFAPEGQIDHSYIFRALGSALVYVSVGPIDSLQSSAQASFVWLKFLGMVQTLCFGFPFRGSKALITGDLVGSLFLAGPVWFGSGLCPAAFRV